MSGDLGQRCNSGDESWIQHTLYLQNRVMITRVMIAATMIAPIQPIIFSEFSFILSKPIM